jgi:hypothetical protein
MKRTDTCLHFIARVPVKPTEIAISLIRPDEQSSIICDETVFGMKIDGCSRVAIRNLFLVVLEVIVLNEIYNLSRFRIGNLLGRSGIRRSATPFRIYGSPVECIGNHRCSSWQSSKRNMWKGRAALAIPYLENRNFEKISAKVESERISLGPARKLSASFPGTKLQSMQLHGSGKPISGWQRAI